MQVMGFSGAFVSLHLYSDMSHRETLIVSPLQQLGSQTRYPGLCRVRPTRRCGAWARRASHARHLRAKGASEEDYRVSSLTLCQRSEDSVRGRHLPSKAPRCRRISATGSYSLLPPSDEGSERKESADEETQRLFAVVCHGIDSTRRGRRTRGRYL